MTDEEWKAAMIDYDKFRIRLKELFVEFNVGKCEKDSYNGQDDYMGIEIYLTTNGHDCLFRDTMAELLEELIP